MHGEYLKYSQYDPFLINILFNIFNCDSPQILKDWVRSAEWITLSLQEQR